jgi:hypothetical protein
MIPVFRVSFPEVLSQLAATLIELPGYEPTVSESLPWAPSL